MITDQKFNLAHFVQYEAKIYLIDKDISDREKMRIKVYVEFIMNYNSINI